MFLAPLSTYEDVSRKKQDLTPELEEFRQWCEELLELIRGIACQGQQRRTRWTANKSCEIHRGLQARDAVRRRNGCRNRIDPALKIASGVVIAARECVEQCHARARNDAHRGEDRAGRPEAQRRVEFALRRVRRNRGVVQVYGAH